MSDEETVRISESDIAKTKQGLSNETKPEIKSPEAKPEAKPETKPEIKSPRQSRKKVKVQKVVSHTPVQQKAKEALQQAAPKGKFSKYLILIVGAGLAIIVGLIVAKRFGKTPDTATAKNPATPCTDCPEATGLLRISDILKGNGR